MNILVLSPNNRGTGVTTVAYSLAVTLNQKGEFVQLIDVNAERPSLMKMYLSVPSNNGKEVNGMENLIQMIRTGTITAEDMSNCAVDFGVDTICVTPQITTKDIIDIAPVTKNAEISGRILYTIIDMSVSDSSSELFKNLITEADICIFVLDQTYTAIQTINSIKSTNEASLEKHDIHPVYVVNRFEECALPMKDIWNELDVKNTKNWFKVRYNKTIMQVHSKRLYAQYVKALHETADPDIANIKADFNRIANYITTLSHRK